MQARQPPVTSFTVRAQRCFSCLLLVLPHKLTPPTVAASYCSCSSPPKKKILAWYLYCTIRMGTGFSPPNERRPITKRRKTHPNGGKWLPAARGHGSAERRPSSEYGQYGIFMSRDNLLQNKCYCPATVRVLPLSVASARMHALLSAGGLGWIT